MTTALLVLAWIVFVGASLLFLLSKAFFLAPSRAGWAMVIANVVYETLERRMRMPRERLDVILFVLSAFTAGLAVGPWFGVAWAVLCGLAGIGALLVERRWASDAPATQMQSLKGRVPLPIPRLIVSLRGPVLRRSAAGYDLGHWPEGLRQRFELIVLNPGLVRPQLPLSATIASASPSIEVTLDGSLDRCPEPGEALRLPFHVRALHAGDGGEVRVEVRHGDFLWRRSLRLASVVPAAGCSPLGVSVRRWPYGCRAGFVWRGDNDLYDPATFQSPQGLRMALGLAARYRMPTTIYLSARLSLEEQEHRAFCERFGWNRHSEEIPSFIRFFREEVDMSNEQEFPTRTDKPFAAEIGNHMYLHYGTHAAADPGNDWRSHAKMGAGRYPWLRSHPCSSLEEQRDNMIRCAESTLKHLGVRTTSYAIPSDVYDASTARAAEAAGIEVGNDTDTTKFERLLLFPKEHHPEGCERLVELTRMTPRDPVNAPQVAVLKFWVGFARRNLRSLVYLAHHHLVMYETNICSNLTSELLRHVLADTEGDVHAATVTSLGRWWRDVLSERTRAVRAEVHRGGIVVRNDADRPIAGIPVEVDLGGGRSFMALVDAPAAGTATLQLGGG